MIKKCLHKKGFTLIEILAVIVILTIIIVIAFPNVLGIINNTKKEAFLSSADLIVSEVERNYIKNVTSETPASEVTYTFQTDQNGVTTQTVTPGTSPTIEVSGDVPKTGTIVVNTAGEVKVDVTDGTNKIVKNFSDEELIIYDIKDATNYSNPYLIGLDANPSLVKGYFFQDKELLVIIGTGATKNYAQVGNNSNSPFFNNPLIKTVIIEKGVTTIGDHLFMDTSAIERVTIPNTVTYIGRKTFQGNELTAVEIPNSVTTISPYAFSINKILTVNIPNKLAVLDEAVFWSNQISEVVFPPLLTTIRKRAFHFNQIKSIIVPSTVTTIDALGLVGIGHSNITWVGKTEEDFWKMSGNSLLGSIGAAGDLVIPSIVKGVTVTSIATSAFSQSNLTSVIIPNTVTSIGNNAFWNQYIQELVIPSSVTTIGASAFAFQWLNKITFERNATTTIGVDAFISLVDNNGEFAISDSIATGNRFGIWRIVNNIWTKEV